MERENNEKASAAIGVMRWSVCVKNGTAEPSAMG